MSNPHLNHLALEECLRTLNHLFIDIKRLTYEQGYEEIVGGYCELKVATLDSGMPTAKLVAAKRLRLGVRATEPKRLAFRLARELKVWAGLEHPHVLPLLGFYLGDDYKSAVLMSEYMGHGDLKNYIAKVKPSLRERLALVRDLTDGLTYLHTQRVPIRHGDLKPGNVLVNSGRRALLADFGLSKALDTDPSGFTTGNDARGTVRYSSPEVLLQGTAAESLSNDIWSWGCLMLEALTDKIPFASIQPEPQLIVALVQGKSPSDKTVYSFLYPPLVDLLAKCWTREPNDRPTAVRCLHIIDSLPSPPPLAQQQLHIPQSVLSPQDGTSWNELRQRFVNAQQRNQNIDPGQGQQQPLGGQIPGLGPMGQSSGALPAGQRPQQPQTTVQGNGPDGAAFFEQIVNLPIEAFRNQLVNFKTKIKALQDQRDRFVQVKTPQTLEQAQKIQVQINGLQNITQQLTDAYQRRQAAAMGLQPSAAGPSGQQGGQPPAMGPPAVTNPPVAQNRPGMGGQGPQDNLGGGDAQLPIVWAPNITPQMAQQLGRKRPQAIARAAQQQQQQQPQQPQQQPTPAPPRISSTQPNSQLSPQVNQQPQPGQPGRPMQFHEFFTTAFNNWLAQRQLTLDPPRVDGKEVELHKLFLMVGAFGGSRAVSEKKLWPVVGAKIGFPWFNGPLPYSKPEVADHLSKIYQVILAEFEVHWHNSLRPRDPMSVFPLPPQLQYMHPEIERLAAPRFPFQQQEPQQQQPPQRPQQPDPNGGGPTPHQMGLSLPLGWPANTTPPIAVQQQQQPTPASPRVPSTRPGPTLQASPQSSGQPPSKQADPAGVSHRTGAERSLLKRGAEDDAADHTGSPGPSSSSKRARKSSRRL